MTNRRKRSSTERLRLFQEKGGECDICRGKICVGEAWHLDHRIPLELSGDDSDDNLFPVHDKCHQDKTRGDVRQIAKAKRQQQKHLGVKKRKGRPMAGTKASGWRKKMNGTVERR